MAKRTDVSRIIVLLLLAAACQRSAFAFEGWIQAVTVRGDETNALLYTVAPNALRVEMSATNFPNPVDIVDRSSGALTLLFPNGSFVHLRPATEAASGMPGMPTPLGGMAMPARPSMSGASGMPSMPQMPARPAMLMPGATNMLVPPGLPAIFPMPGMSNMPALPPGIGPQAQGTPNMPTMPVMPNMPPRPAMPAMPSMPARPTMPMPMMPGAKLELQATGEKTNLLGFACERYELKQRGETMEIWATDQLLPYQPYLRNQPRRFGPQRIEEQWPGLLTDRKLFPLLAILRRDNGPERYRFEVQSVTPQKLKAEDTKLFQPPAGYVEIKPPPF